MSLRFESVSLRNFGPYRDIGELDLATEPDAPIVVIHGENTLGKTSLFRALRWCLYGSPEAGKTPSLVARHLIDYMNQPAWRDGETVMQVGMRFTANGHSYHLMRTANFEGSVAPKLSRDLRVDAEVIQQASIEAEIGRILHPQIAEFFLFDAETLRDFYDRLNSDRDRDLLRGSIENVLGIPALQLAERDVTLLTSDVMERQAKAIKRQGDAQNARRQMRELKSKQESIDKDRREIEANLRKARADLEDVNERIATVAELKADAREMESLESAIAGGLEEEKALKREMQQILTAGWLAPAAGKLTEALQRVIDRNDNAQRRQDAIKEARDRVKVLQEQVRGGTCPTCHQELPSPDDTTLQDLSLAEGDLKQLEDEVGDGPNMPLERRIRALIDETTIPAYQERQSKLNKILAAQFDRNRRLRILKERIRDNDAAKIRQMGDQQDRLEKAVETYENSLEEFKPQQDKINAQQDRLANTLRRLGGGDPTLAAEAFFFEYTKALLAQTIERYQERTRAEVEQAASEMFVKMIRDPGGYQGLQISRDYRVELVGQHGAAISTSEGGKYLLALSLIGALKKAAVRGGPVVLDSPLARLDLEHRANVLQTWVPELGDQAILLVQSGELTEGDARQVMGSRIGHEYRIYRPNRDPQEAAIERTQ